MTLQTAFVKMSFKCLKQQVEFIQFASTCCVWIRTSTFSYVSLTAGWIDLPTISVTFDKHNIDTKKLIHNLCLKSWVHFLVFLASHIPVLIPFLCQICISSCQESVAAHKILPAYQGITWRDLKNPLKQIF